MDFAYYSADVMGWRGFRQLIVLFAEVDFVVFLFLDPQLTAMDAC